MKNLPGIILVLILACAGCETKSTGNRRARTAFQSGQQQGQFQQQQAQQQAQLEAANVSVRGNVRYPIVQWYEGLTLSRAVVSAVYLGQNNPSVIYVVHNGERMPIDARELLQGKDMPLAAGDVVEIVP